MRNQKIIGWRKMSQRDSLWIRYRKEKIIKEKIHLIRAIFVNYEINCV